jgi:alkanesulfonate monooxygenase SsuD/methylene tetrahydromethanopterin reductase-like flavin-dependent oxidoreductase (luciferase family)
MRALWTEEKTDFAGEFFNFSQCISRPRPPQGSIPVIVGGHTPVAARRAGRLGEGFFPGNASISEISDLLAIMRTAAHEAGRDPDHISIIAGAGGAPGDALNARVEQLAAIGVEQVIVPAYPPERLATVGADLISRFG